MSVTDVDRIVSRLVDEELSPSDLETLCDMLERDPNQVEKVRSSLMLSRLLSQAFSPSESAEAFVAATQTRLQAEATGESFVESTVRRLGTEKGLRRSRRFRLKILAPLAAAATVLLLAGLWLWNSERGTRHEDVVARVAKAVSGVKCWAPGGPPRELVVGDNVREGDRIGTGKNGSVTLTWVKQSTTVVLSSSSELSVRSVREHRLHRGRLIATVAQQPAGKPFVLTTPHARATVLGTRFRCDVQGNGNKETEVSETTSVTNGRSSTPATWLHVADGQVRFTRLSDGASIDVAKGQLAVAGEGCVLKVYSKGATHVYGPVILREDFEGDASGIEILGVYEPTTPPVHMMFRPHSQFSDKESYQSYHRISTNSIRGQTTRCLELFSRKNWILLGMREPIREKAFVIEFDQLLKGGRAVGVTDYRGVITTILPLDVHSLVTNNTWTRQRREVVIDQIVLRNKSLTRVSFMTVKFYVDGRGGGSHGFTGATRWMQRTRGRVFLDNFKVRALLKVPQEDFAGLDEPHR